MENNTNNNLESYSSFDNRIKKIKEYIDDIRVDLEDLKHNENNSNNNNNAEFKRKYNEELYNSDVYSFQEETKRNDNDEGQSQSQNQGLISPNDHVFNSINTQELIQNMNSSLTKNFSNDNVTNSNLLLSNSSYNLNFNYNSNYDKKVKEEIYKSDMKSVKITNNKCDDNSILNSPHYDNKIIEGDYESSLVRKSQHSSPNSYYKNMNYEKRKIYSSNNMSEETFPGIGRNDYQNINNNQENNDNYVEDTPQENFENQNQIYICNNNFSEDEQVYSDREARDNTYNQIKSTVYDQVYIDQSVRDNTYSQIKSNAYELSSIHSPINHSEIPKDTNVSIIQNNQGKISNYHGETLSIYSEPKETYNKKINSYTEVNPNLRHYMSNEPPIKYSNPTLNYNYNKPNTFITKEESSNPQNSLTINQPVVNRKRQEIISVERRKLNNNQDMSNYNIDCKSRSNYNNSNVSQYDDNDNLKLNYNYNTGSQINKHNNQLIQSLDDIGVGRSPSYSPGKYSNDHYIPQHHVKYNVIENRSSELERQIADLHIMINELQVKNSMLQMEVVQLKQNSSIKSNFQQNNNQRSNSNVDHFDYQKSTNNKPSNVTNNREIFNNSSESHIIKEIGLRKEEIMNKLYEQSKQLRKAKKMEDFIEKINGLYSSLYNIKDKNKSNIKILWRWIRNIIKHVGKDQTYDINQQINTEICQSLISFYKLKDVNDLKLFINDFINSDKHKNREQQQLRQIMDNKNQLKSQLIIK